MASGSKLGEPDRREPSDASLFLPTNGSLRSAELVARARFHFAEDQHIRSSQNEIDLARLATPVASNQYIAAARVPTQCFVLTKAPAGLRR